MNSKKQITEDNKLKFFGKITASITHEIKNALATINENAGLLTDYSAMAGEGRPLNPDRLNALSRRITDQVKRSDSLLKCMNRFAHSVDEPIKMVDLNEILQLFTAISARFAALRGITIDYRDCAVSINIRTSPFLLINALFLCLESSMEAVEQGQSITLKPEQTDSGARIYFGPLNGLGHLDRDKVLSSHSAELMEALLADFIVDVDAGIIALDLLAHGMYT